MEDTDPGPQLFLLQGGGETVDWLILSGAILLVIVTVAASTAIRNFRWSRLARRSGSKERLQALEEMLKEERALLDSLLIVRILASLVLLVVLFDFFAPEFTARMKSEPGRFLAYVGTALGVFLILPFGIVRGLVRARPEPALLILAPVARMLATVIWPLRKLNDGFAIFFARAFGVEKTDEEESEEVLDEIRDAVSEGEREGALDDDEREMIESIIEFHDLAVSEIMTPRTSVTGVRNDSSVDEVVQLIVEKGHSRLPVYEESIDNVLGVVFAKDILANWQQREGTPPLAELMRPPHFIPESKNISDLLRELRQNKTHMAIVLDEYGGMAGIVTMEDIVEEIVGEIADEHDPDEGEEEELMLINEREAEVSARLHVDELNEAMNLELPEDPSYDTVGGFLFSELGRVPATGEICRFENLQFEILEADPRRINRVKVVVSE